MYAIKIQDYYLFDTHTYTYPPILLPISPL